MSGETSVETVDEWYDRYDAHRVSFGQYSMRYKWDRWVSPRIGSMRWVDVGPDDVERIRDALDKSIATRMAGGSGVLARSAIDIWHHLTGAIRTARRCKLRELRVLAGRPDPCVDVEPPGDPRTRRARRKTFLYPVEFARLVTCVDVPREWLELYAIAIYTYMRPGELRALRWSDVDLDHRIIHVSNAWHYTEQKMKAPKTLAGIRDVLIEPTLLPLLERLRGAPEDLVVPQISAVWRSTLPQMVRRHLCQAGVTRSALHTSTDTAVRANFRSWRDTGITWLAMAGVDVVRIARRAGHEDLRATNRYVKMAEDLTGELGTPFPELPEELVKGT